jgi:hypothetical protein
MGRVAWLVAGVLLVGLLVGCGGGGDEFAPPAGDTGQVSGRVVGESDPTQFAIALDGAPTSIRPGASGDFLIPDVSPGPHTVGIVAPGGMQGAWVPVDVEPGQDTNIGDVTPVLGGQIAGIVTKVLEDGTIEPVQGVEVTATSQVTWEPGDPGNPDGTVPIGRTGEQDQIVVSAYTNENGSYLMEAVPTGSYDVLVVVPGYDPQVLWVWVDAGSTAVADFRVYPAPEQGVGTVEGVVTGEGAPLEGVMVTLTTRSPWPVPLPMEAVDKWLDSRPGGGMPCSVENGCIPPSIEVQVFNTLTDALGHYSLNVPIGNHFIEAWLDGWNWAGQDVTIEKDQTTTVDFELTKWEERPIPVEPPKPD